MQSGLRLPRCGRQLLLLLLVMALALTVWLGRWPTELVAPRRPLLPELHRTAPGAAPEQTIRLQTVLGSPAEQQSSHGNPRLADPPTTSQQPVETTAAAAGNGSSPVTGDTASQRPPQAQPSDRAPRPVSEPRPNQPAGPFSQVVRVPAASATTAPPNGTRTILY